ncbi:hypothetical protein [Streptomyces nanshensis]|uniref:hypothetical protein n=1 Tax=Streptomyces nanshensis TaxID=518642 RepID=UPI00114CA63A|nr:hypothetical protein [Streptomyces nanshensis]
MQGLAASGAAAAGQREADLVGGAGVAPAGDLLAADGEDLGGAVRPVAALLAVLPPDDEQLAVDVAEAEGPPAVQGGGQPQGVPEQDALGADDDGAFEGVEDQCGPGAGDADALRAVASARRGGGRLRGQLGVGLVQCGPAQLVQDAGAQGGGEQGHHVVGLEEPHRLRGDLGGHGTEARELVEGGLESGESPGGRVLLGAGGQPLAQDSGEHGVGGQPGHACVAHPLAASATELADGAAQQGAEDGVSVEGGEVPRAGCGVGQPAVEGEARGVPGALVPVVRLGDRDSGGQAEVEDVQVGGALPAALEQLDGACVGAQPVRRAGDQREGLRAAARGGPVAAAVRLPAGEPVRRGDGRRTLAVSTGSTRSTGNGGGRGPGGTGSRGVGGLGSAGQGGEQVLGAGLGQQREPAALGVHAPAAALGEGLREEAEEPGAHGRVPLGEGDDGGAVGRPERGGGAHHSRRADQVGHQVAFGALAVQPGGLDQGADVLGQGRVGRHARGTALDQQTAELRPGVRRGEPGDQVAHVLPQRLDGEGTGEGELQEHGPLPVLVHDEAVHALGLAGLAEEGGRVDGVLRLEEEAGDLLVVGGEEVGHGPAEPGAQLVEALLGGTGAGLGLSAQPLDVLDQGQGVVPVGRVVDQGPGGEAQRLAADLADDGGLGGPGQPQELQGQVLGLTEGAGHEADHGAVAEGGVRVGAGGERVGVVPSGGAGR